MDYLKSYEYWKTNPFFDEKTREELSLLDSKKNEKEIIDRFYKNLEFGTAGLRGIMAAGTNCMNKYTVGKATLGLAEYLIERYGESNCRKRGVVIAYDTRNNSEYFSQITSSVLTAKGVKVYYYKNTSPIPILSYGVRKFNALAGVVITASHNPREYNGYKVYDETGCQITSEMAKGVAEKISKISDYSVINFSRNEKLIQVVDLTDEFVSLITALSKNKDKKSKANLKVVYTPLHGSGFVPVCKVLKKDGFSDLHVVEEQALPNGDFPTVSAPNPENHDALKLGIELAEKIGADIVLGTDPDSDRVGLAVKTNHGFKLVTGNQIAALLIDFLVSKLDKKKTPKPIIIKTIVSSELGEMIAEKHGVKTISVLTGFKYIGEKINLFERAKLSGEKKFDYDFLIGYEESYGYLIGKHARDKDGVVASMFLCEIAAEIKVQNKTLVDRLNELYGEYGYIVDHQDNLVLKGKDGADRIARMMKFLREKSIPIKGVKKIIDYSKPVCENSGFEKLPASNVLKFILEDDSWIAVRPSGTEPKIKVYYSMRGEVEKQAIEKLIATQRIINKVMKIK